MARRRGPCPECGGEKLYIAQKPVSAGGGYAPNYLPGLGGRFSAAKFHVVVCSDCGLTRVFAEDEPLRKLKESSKWKRF